MEKISGLGVSASRQEILARMQQTAACAQTGVISPGFTVAPADASLSGASAQPVSFAKIMNTAIDNVDQMQHAASARQTAIDTGQSDDLTGAMIESQKASVAFSAMMQVRNKLTTALDEVMNIAL